MWMNTLWAIPYLVATVAGGLICAIGGPKGPGTARWRVPAVLGFGCLVLQHLIQTGQTMVLMSGSSPSFYFSSPLYQLLAVLMAVLTVVGLVLIAVAVVRGRGPVGIFTAGGWGGPGAAQPGGQPTAQPQPFAPQPFPAPQQPAPQQPAWPGAASPSTGQDEHGKTV